MKKIITLACLICMITISCQVDQKSSTSKNMFTSGEWIDLSHSYDQKTPYWPTSNGFELDTVFEGMTDGGYYYSAFSFSSAEHGGTHIDAPIHFSEGKQTVDEIPLSNLIGPGIVIDVQDSVRNYIDYQISVEDFQRWESDNGDIPDGSIVLLRTGMSNVWPDKDKYMGTNQTGAAAVALLHFPGLHPEAAEWLTKNRKIAAIGIDTPSIDYGRTSDFMSHRILFEQNIPAFENLNDLEKIEDITEFINRTLIDG